MANIFLIGLDRATADQIGRVVSVERHTVFERTHNFALRDLAAGGIVFAGGSPSLYLPLLWRVRRDFPTLPFVVVAKSTDAITWLEALEAGATDYFCPPLGRRQIQWLMESVIPLRGSLSDAKFSPGYAMRNWNLAEAG